MGHDVDVQDRDGMWFVVTCSEGCYLGRTAVQDTREAAEKRAALHAQLTRSPRYDGAHQEGRG